MSEPATAWARITFCFGIFRSSLRTWTSRLQGGPATWTLRRIDVDAAGRSDDENARLPPELPQKANAQPVKISLELEPYGVALLWVLAMSLVPFVLGELVKMLGLAPRAPQPATRTV